MFKVIIALALVAAAVAQSGSGDTTVAATTVTYPADAEVANNVVQMKTDVACSAYNDLSAEEKAEFTSTAGAGFSAATGISSFATVSCEGAASAAARRLARARRQASSSNVVFFFVVPEGTSDADISTAVDALVAAVQGGQFEIEVGGISITAANIAVAEIGQAAIIVDSIPDGAETRADDICEAAGCCSAGKGGGKAAKATKGAKSPKEARVAGAAKSAKSPKEARVAGATKSAKSPKSPKTTAARHARAAADSPTKAPKSVKSVKEARVAGDSPVKAAKVPKTTESAAEIQAREAICALCTCSGGKSVKTKKAKKSKSGAFSSFGPAAKTAGAISVPLALIAAAAMVITGQRSRRTAAVMNDATETTPILVDEQETLAVEIAV